MTFLVLANSAMDGPLVSPGVPVAPAAWIMPLAVLFLVFLSLHAGLLRRADMPPSRRRIRIANALIMIFATPTLAYALSMAPAFSREFLLAWMLVLGLMAIVVFLAMLDVVNSLRLRFKLVRALRREFALARAGVASREGPSAPAHDMA